MGKKYIINSITGKKIEDLTGQTFERLTVISLDEDKMIQRAKENKRSRAYWFCKCNCGNEELISTTGQKLKSGHTTSCGCFKRENTHNIKFDDLTGLKFGHLTVIKLDKNRIKETKNGVTYWLCKCDCGNEILTSVRAGNLNNGTSKSCGCENKKSIDNHYKQKALNGDSFAEKGIEIYGEDFINMYWSEDNIVNPWEISKNSNKKILLKGIKESDYEIAPDYFFMIPIEKHKRITNKMDSFAQWNIDNLDNDFLEKYWSDKNVIDPFEIGKCSKKKVFIKCQYDKSHDDYEISCGSFYSGSRCSSCTSKLGELEVQKILNNNKIKYNSQYKYDDLLGTKNGLLSYDFYLPNYNLLVEYQGIQHYEPVDFFGGEEQFEIQQEHDRRKREYAELNNINLLEIPYWDFDNIEEIVMNKLKEITLYLNQAI